MRGLLAKNPVRSPIWIILGIGLLVLAALLLVAALLNPGSSTPGTVTIAAPDATATAPGQVHQGEPLAASVNGYTITRSYLSRTVQLNRVLGGLSGASALGEQETLERLIRAQLILQGVEAVAEPTDEDVDGFIGALEQNWGVTDGTVVQRLEAVGLDRAFLTDTIARLLTVQAGVASLEEAGHDISEWLVEQERDADIRVFEDLTSADEEEGSPTAQPTDRAEPLTSMEEPQPGVLDFAPGFTLDQAGGGAFTLSEQLEESPVVLVFFEKCG